MIFSAGKRKKKKSFFLFFKVKIYIINDPWVTSTHRYFPIGQDILEEEEMELDWDFRFSLINDIVKALSINLIYLCIQMNYLKMSSHCMQFKYILMIYFNCLIYYYLLSQQIENAI